MNFVSTVWVGLVAGYYLGVLAGSAVAAALWVLTPYVDD